MAVRVATRRHAARCDSAGTEIIGTVLIFGLTVVAGAFLGIVTWNLLQDGDPAPPDAAFDLAVQPGSAALTRTGGEVLDMADLVVSWTVDGRSVPDAYTSKTGDATRWNLGDTFRLTHANITADSRVEVTVAHAAGGTLAALTKRATSETLASGGPVFPSAIAPLNVRADGSTLNRFAVNVSHPRGLAYLASVTLDLSPLNASSALQLTDQGTGGDATAGDGTFTGESLLPPFPAGPVRWNMTLTAKDLDGRVARTLLPLNVNVTPYTFVPIYNNQSVTYYQNVTVDGCTEACRLAAKVSTGTSFNGVPPSANISYMRITNLTWDPYNINRLTGDVILLRVVDLKGHIWAATVNFAKSGNSPTVGSIDMHYSYAPTRASSSTICQPTSVLYVSNTTVIDILRPWTMTGPSWTCTSNTAGHYQHASVMDPTVMTIARIGDPANDQNSVIVNADVEYG